MNANSQEEFTDCKGNKLVSGDKIRIIKNIEKDEFHLKVGDEFTIQQFDARGDIEIKCEDSAIVVSKNNVELVD